MKKIILGLLLISVTLFSQESKGPKTIVDRLKSDILFLSDDKLEGRETGTIGEQLALEYLQKRFNEIGLKTKTHSFQFNDNVEVDFSSNNDALYPTRYSANGSLNNVDYIDVNFGIHALDLDYSDYISLDVRGKIALINTSSPDGIHPHSKYINYHDLKIRADIAKEKGAIAVIYYTDDKHAETPLKKFKKINSAGIPVLFFDDSKDKITAKIRAKINLTERRNKGVNLIAEVNNSKENTIIIGAHYDHIGWGAEGSRYRGEPAIHNGADDNASGTAGILELARVYNNSKYDNYNYLFIAFSGEEKGLLGSNAFAKSDLFNPHKINYMINMDMIGRLNEDGMIAVYGTGTSPRWDLLLKENMPEKVTISTTKSGVGPSDHTSFYLQDIPVLHFFTGAHEDYHKPSDDADKINYEGIETVLNYIQNLINDLDDEKKLLFTKTKSDENRKVPKFSVTLGVIPDYLYSEKGMRIDGVTDGKPAFNSGMQKGDVVLQLGEIKVLDMMTYMKALGHYAKGDKVKAIVNRDGTEIELMVQF
tara:strand:- start:8127 stop:9731 length:1605 start_codon:yes stop_codon:yes gene_type:complete